MKTKIQKAKQTKRTKNSKIKNIFKFFLYIPAVILMLFASVFFTPSANALVGINRTINFQGKVVNKTSETNITDGTYSFTFKFYDAATAGTQLPSGAAWTETKNLTVTAGVFRTSLGDTTAIPTTLDFNSDSLYLDMTFNGETFTTRIRMTSVPYAFNAEKVNGLTVTNTANNPFTAATSLKIGDGKTVIANNTVTFSGTDGKTLTLNDSTGFGTNAITFAGTETLTLAAAKSVLFADAFSTSGSFATTLTAIGVTNVTLPTTGTLLTNTGSANQTITSTQASGTVFGLSDVTAITGAVTGQSITLSGIGAFDQTGLQFNLSGATGANLNDIIGSGSTWKVSKLGAASFASIGATSAGTGAFTTLSSTGNTTLATGTGTTNTFGSGASSINTIGSTSTPGALTLHGATSLDNTFAQTFSSTTAFQVQNSSSTPILKIDTSTNNTNNLVTNPSIESAIAGNWTAKGTATVTQDATDYYYGSNSLRIQTAAANDGAKQNVTLASATTYTMTMYARYSAGNMSTFEIGRSENGTTDTACLTAQTVIRNGWSRYTCTFLTGTVSGSTYIYAKQTDATARSYINIDAVILQTEANNTPQYHEGQIALQGSITTPLLIQNSNNSTTAFQVMSSKGANIFSVDSTDSNILAGNAGFEINTSGWTYSGTPGSLLRDSTQAYIGSYSLKVVTTANANNGAKYTLANGTPFSPNLAISTQYTLSWYAKLDAASAAFTDIVAGYSPDGGAETACTPSLQAVVSGGWTRYSCTITTPVTATNASAYIIVKQTGASAHTFYLDAVQLELGANATAYGAGNIALSAPFTSPVVFRGLSDSTTAFQIQNGAGSTNLFTVDTLNNRVGVGTASPVAKFDVSGGTGLTTGTVLNASGFYTHTAAETGSLATLTFTDNSTNTTGTTNTNGLVVASTFNTSGAGIKNITDIKVGPPALTACVTGACNWDGVQINTQTSTNSLVTQNGLDIVTSGTSTAGTVTGINIGSITAGAATETGLKIGTGWDTGLSITTSAAERGIQVTAGAVPTTDMVNITNAGQGVINAGINAFSIDYVGGLANVESAAQRINLTPGGTSGGIWSGLRIVAGTAASGVTQNGLKFDAITGGAGNEYAINIGSGWDRGITSPDGIALTIISGTTGAITLDSSTTGAVNVGNNANAKTVTIGNTTGASVLNLNAGSGSINFNGNATWANLGAAVGGSPLCYTTVGNLIRQAGGATCTLSSRRFKHDIESLPEGGLSEVNAMNPVSFTVNWDGTRQVGFVAEELNQVDSRLVFYEPDGVTPRGVRYENITSILAKAVQELDQKVEGLKFDSTATHDASFVKTLSIDTFRAYTGQDVALQLTKDGKFIVKDENGSPAITFDSQGNGTFKGTLTADKIKAKQIEGLDILTGRITALENNSATPVIASDSAAILGDEIASSSSSPRNDMLTLSSLSVDGLATVSADLRVKGNGLIEGVLNVIDTLTAQNLVVNRIADFFGSVIFHKDVTFAGRPTFNNDTAGYVVIHKNSDRAEVKFEDDYKTDPIINASLVSDKLTDDKFIQLKNEGACDADQDISVCQERMDKTILDDKIQFIITNRTNHGFSILLRKTAGVDMKFSWNALAISDKKQISTGEISSLKGGENKQ